MAKLLRIGLQFLLLSIGLYVLSIVLLNSVNMGGKPILFHIADGVTWYGGDTYKRYSEYEKMSENDVVVIGSSHTYRGYDPRIFEAKGLSMFNLGSNSQTMAHTSILIEEVLDKKQSGLVLVEIYPMLFRAEGFESSSMLIANVNSDKAALKIGRGLKDIRVINMLTARLANKLRAPYWETEEYTTRGYCSQNDSIGESINEFTYREEFIRTETNELAFEKLLSQLSNFPTKVVLVTHPQPFSQGSKEFIDFRAYVSKRANLAGVPYLDFSGREEVLPEHHYYDSHHLNQAGVDVYNALLIDYLSNNDYLAK